MSKIPYVDNALPIALAGEGALAYGASTQTDNEDLKNMLQAMAWFGGTGASVYKGTRFLGKPLAAMAKPGQEALSAVQAGRTRMATDVANLDVKSIRDAIAHQRAQTASTRGALFDSDTARLSNQLKQAKANAANHFAQNAASQNQAVTQAHAGAMDMATGKVDVKKFTRELKKTLGNKTMHNGVSIDVDTTLAKAIAKGFGTL
jgi:hypothetical protein